jgi:hypothetical protein
MPTRDRMLLRADHGDGNPGWSDISIVEPLNLHPGTVPTHDGSRYQA